MLRFPRGIFDYSPRPSYDKQFQEFMDSFMRHYLVARHLTVVVVYISAPMP